MLSRISRTSPIHQSIQNAIIAVTSRFASSSTEIPWLSPKLTQSYSYHESTVPLLYHSIGEHLDKLAKEHSNSECYVFKSEGNKKYTYQSFLDEVNSLATSLINLGFEKGDRIGVWLPNTSENVIFTYAASKAGVVKVNINPAYMERELSYCLNKVGCKGLVIRPNVKVIDSIKILSNLIPELGQSAGELKSKAVPSLKHVILTAGDYSKNNRPSMIALSGMLSYTDLIHRGAKSSQDQRQKRQAEVDGDTPLAIFYTSGTTGQPKAATLTNFTVLNGSFPLHFTNPNIMKRVSCPIPIFHIFGEVAGTQNINVPGYSTVYPAILPDTLETMRTIEEERCTTLIGPPIIYRDILTHPRRKEFDMSSLEYAVIGATPVSRNLMEQIEREIPIKTVFQAFGQTENSGALTMSIFAGNDERRYSSVGKPMPRIEMKIVDEKDRVVPIGQEGEICGRGFNLMKGYYGDDAKTRETITATGWLKTGDLGTMDEDGYVYYRSRRKEMIIVGGLNVYPVEVENLLLEHPQIADAQIFGIPDQRYGEVACAWIKLKPEQTIEDIEDVRRFLSSKIAFYKVPKHIKIIDSFVNFMTPTGKVQKFKLTEAMVKELSTKERPK